MSMNDEQRKWQGEVVSIQSRSTVWRYVESIRSQLKDALNGVDIVELK